MHSRRTLALIALAVLTSRAGAASCRDFVAAPAWRTAILSQAIVSADFNRDGHRDVAVSNSYDGTVTIYLGNGAGAFTALAPARAGLLGFFGLAAIAAGDFNADGKPDLAVTANETLSILIGAGDGTFAAQQQSIIPQGSTYRNASRVIAADVNHDGKIDLVITTSNGDVAIYTGTADGTFTTPQFVQTRPQPLGVAVADFNRDGRPDIATANGADNSISVLAADGNGGFIAPVSYGAGSFTENLVAADFNGDGRADIAATNRNSDTVSVFLDAGGGAFAATVNIVVADEPRALVADDFDGDGRVDLAVAGGSGVSVLAGNGSGGFGAPQTFAFGGHQLAILAGDFDEDARRDLISLDAFMDFALLAGTGDGHFVAAPTYAQWLFPRQLATGDFDGDGKSDIALIAGIATVSVVRGDGTPLRNIQLHEAASLVAAGDFDGDGKPDLAVTGARLTIFAGSGDGSFRELADFAAPSNPRNILARDLNGDGRSDLVAVNDAGDAVLIVLATNGGFAPPLTLETGQSAFSIASLDFNGDGAVDLAVSGSNITILTGDGHGGFTKSSLGVASNAVAAGDFNGDGRDDLAAAAEGVTLLLSKGDGSFNAVAALPNEQDASALAAADMDGDGNLDLVAAHAGAADASIFFGNGTGGLAGRRDYSAGERPTQIAVADVNGDGAADIVVPHRGATILLNSGGCANITSVSPALGPLAGDQTVVISGNHLAGASSVNIGGSAATIVANTASAITIRTPRHVSGATTIAVKTAGGTAANAYVYSAPANLGITSSVSAPPYVAGATLTYTLTVTNSGPAGATNVIVLDELPAGATLVRATPSQGTCSGTTTVTCAMTGLANGASATLTIVVTAPSQITVTHNTATVTAAEYDPLPANNAVTAAVAIGDPLAIPALSQWMLVALAMAVASMAVFILRAALPTR